MTRTAWISAAAALCVACSDPAGPRVPDNFPMPPALGRDSLVVGDVVYVCGRLKPDVPTYAGWVLLDLYFGVDPDVLPDAPNPSLLEVLQLNHAEILHRFNVPAFRVIVPAAELEDLPPSFGRAVSFRDRFDVWAHIGFDGGEEEDWIALVEGVGGWGNVRQRGLVEAAVPDAGIPDLRATGRVTFVESFHDVVCAVNPADRLPS